MEIVNYQMFVINPLCSSVKESSLIEQDENIRAAVNAAVANTRDEEQRTILNKLCDNSDFEYLPTNRCLLYFYMSQNLDRRRGGSTASRPHLVKKTVSIA